MGIQRIFDSSERILSNFLYYDRSCGKVIFSQASVILSEWEGCVWQTPPAWADHPPGDPPWADTPWADTPWADHPQADTSLGRHPLSRRPLQRTVRILLECILVSMQFSRKFGWRIIGWHPRLGNPGSATAWNDNSEVSGSYPTI